MERIGKLKQRKVVKVKKKMLKFKGVRVIIRQNLRILMKKLQNLSNIKSKASRNPSKKSFLNKVSLKYSHNKRLTLILFHIKPLKILPRNSRYKKANRSHS